MTNKARQCQTDTSSNRQANHNYTVAPKGFLLNRVVVFHTWLVVEPSWEVCGLDWGLR